MLCYANMALVHSPLLGDRDMTEKTPELKHNPHSYREWMASIPFGLTPDGKKLTRIHYVDEVSDAREGRSAHPSKDEFVGKVTLRYVSAFGEWVSVDMTPGSILVSYGT